MAQWGWARVFRTYDGADSYIECGGPFCSKEEAIEDCRGANRKDYYHQQTLFLMGKCEFLDVSDLLEGSVDIDTLLERGDVPENYGWASSREPVDIAPGWSRTHVERELRETIRKFAKSWLVCNAFTLLDTEEVDFG